MIEIEIELTSNLDDLEQAFLNKLEHFKDTLAANFEKEVVSTTLYKDQTGNLRRSMQKKSSLHFYFPLDYTSYVENGRPAIQAAPGKALKFTINGKTLFRKSVKAAAPRPFIANSINKVQNNYLILWESS